MQTLNGVYGKIQKIDHTLEKSRVYFEDGSNHLLTLPVGISVGAIILIDSHGSIWIKG